MSEMRWFRCLNCREVFEVEVLTPEEARRAREQRQSTSAIHCPRCNHTDLRDGRE